MQYGGASLVVAALFNTISMYRTAVREGEAIVMAIFM
jgi:hypothetical protein